MELFRPIPRTAIAGTAAAVTPRTVASVPLKSLRRFFGRFEIVSSASDRAAAESLVRTLNSCCKAQDILFHSSHALLHEQNRDILIVVFRRDRVEFSNAASKTETNRDNTNLEIDNLDIFNHPGNAEKMEMD